MSLTAQVSALATRIGTEFKTAYGRIGTLANLTTTAKGDLVSAINEVKAGGVAINDTTPSSSTVYSSSKTNSVATAAASSAVASLVGSAPASLDTIFELAAQLQSDESAAAALTTAVANRLRFDAAQTLTGAQQTQGQANLGVLSSAQVGDPTTDFVAVFVAALS